VGEGFSGGDRMDRMEPSTAIVGGLIGWREVMFGNCGCPSLRLKHYSLRTEKAYLYWIRRYIHANRLRHPRELDGVTVERFLSRLATEDLVAPSTQNQALNGAKHRDYGRADRLERGAV